MEGNLLPGSLDEFLERHPEVCVPFRGEGNWHATVSLKPGYGYLHGRDEAELLAKLTAALGG